MSCDDCTAWKNVAINRLRELEMTRKERCLAREERDETISELDSALEEVARLEKERDGARRLANEAIEEAAELANVIELICNAPGDHCPGKEIGGEELVQCQGHEGRCVAHWLEIYRGLGRGER